VRRRRHDLCVLKALGFRPVQVGACVGWQAMTMALVSLAIGLPLGVASGRWTWRVIADATPLRYVPPTTPAVVALCIPATILLILVVSVLPSLLAARLRPSEVLRTE
jgi:ABC-type lipoprotein release transport system permease subunit